LEHEEFSTPKKVPKKVPANLMYDSDLRLQYSFRTSHYTATTHYTLDPQEFVLQKVFSAFSAQFLKKFGGQAVTLFR
jgi:hypothetical protein